MNDWREIQMAAQFRRQQLMEEAKSFRSQRDFLRSLDASGHGRSGVSRLLDGLSVALASLLVVGDVAAR